jgi:hypothetical protein
MGRTAGTLALGLGALALAAPVAAQGPGYAYEKIALGGEIVPGTGGATRANGFTGIALNNKGHVAFVNELVGGSASFGVFLHVGAGTQTLSLAGESAPGSGGGSYVLPGGFVRLNDADEVSFMAVVSGGSASTGVFLARAGADVALVLEGDAAPGSGGVFAASANGFSVHHLDESGTAAFRGDVVGGSVASGLWLATPGAELALVLAGASAPGGGSYADFDAPSQDAAGSVAFPASVTGGPAPGGLFLEHAGPGPGAALLLVGDTAPGTDGGQFADFLYPVLNVEGQVAFLSNVSGGAATGGVFLFTPEAGAIDVALEDGVAPGTGGGRYAVVPSVPDLNDAGDLVFPAALGGGASTAGVFRRDGAGGVTSPVVLDGIPAPDSGGAAFAQFDLVAINDAGQVAFHATLSDGTRGVFLASPAPPSVPALGAAPRALLVAILLCSATSAARRSRRTRSARS